MTPPRGRLSRADSAELSRFISPLRLALLLALQLLNDSQLKELHRRYRHHRMLANLDDDLSAPDS